MPPPGGDPSPCCHPACSGRIRFLTSERADMDESMRQRNSLILQLPRRVFVAQLIGGAALLCARPLLADDLVPSGRVTISQVQVAFIGSGNLGGGTLSFGGRSYDFTIGGLGIGGFGVSKIEAYGTVY